MSSYIPVNEPLLTGNEKKYLEQCIDTGWISSEGSFVTKFEQLFATRVGRKYGIAVCNGSSALDAAIAALEIKSGDEIIIPTFTIISCASAVVRSGAKPVLVDSDPMTWNMDVEQIENRITSSTRAIMVVHTYGLPVDMDPIISIAEKHNLKIIEDAAQMHGQTYKGKPCGGFGDISTFSFYANKHITTGEGGMIVTDDESLAKRCRSLRNLCFQDQRRFVHEELGWNFRMTNIQAAVGLAQLEQLDTFEKKKRSMGAKYIALLEELKDVQLPLPKTDYADNIYWVFGMVLKCSNQTATEVMKELEAQGIGTRPFFWPMHLQPVFMKMGLFEDERYRVSEHLGHNGFYIPSGLALSDEQLERTANTICEILR